jgi:hypothetical protein
MGDGLRRRSRAMSGAWGDDKVLLAEWHERVSAKGRVYASGLLGHARVVAFRQETDDGPIWRVYLTAGKKQQEERNGNGRTRHASTSVPASTSRSTSPPADAQHAEVADAGRFKVQRLPKPEKSDPGTPFHDDDISDIGRGAGEQ